MLRNDEALIKMVLTIGDKEQGKEPKEHPKVRSII